MKKLAAAAIVATLLAGSALAATPVRSGANVDEAEGAISTPLLVGLFALVGAVTVVAIESAENNEAPASA